MLGSFNLFGREIGFYPLLALIGVLVTGFFVYRKSMKRGLDEVEMVIMLLFSAIGIFIGGHILYAITNIDKFYLFGYVKSFDDFIQVVQFIFGGQVFYGGLIGGIIAGVIYAKVKKLEDFSSYTDILAAGVPLFHCFGRIGCFLGGCCYGIESDFGFVFTHSLIESANGVRRFPVQLFESGFNLMLFVFILMLLNKNRLKNMLFPLYLMIYAVGRFILEFFRGDTYRGFLFGLSTSQIISILLFIICGIYFIIKNNRTMKKTA